MCVLTVCVCVWLWLVWGSQALGPMIHCGVCDPKAMSVCKALPSGCELAKEPGCGCCLTCARTHSQSCGIYTERCAAGLRCLPAATDTRPLHSLLTGRGVCSPDTGSRNYPSPALELTHRLQQPTDMGSVEQLEGMGSEGYEEGGYTSRPVRKKTDRLPKRKAAALKRDRQNRLQRAKAVSSTENVAHESHQADDKHESEHGPCKRQMETVLQSLKKAALLRPLEIYIPNCDRKGFYKRKQCKPSKGRRKGICWCVDKYGLRIPGSEFLPHDSHCHSLTDSN